MSTTLIKQKLHRYIETAEAKKLKAFYTIVEGEIKTQSSTITLQELNHRISDFENSKVKGISWEEVKQRARKSATRRHA